MKYSTKSVRIAGILAASSLVAGYSFHVLLNQGVHRDPSAEMSDRRLEVGPMREAMARATDTSGYVGGLIIEKQYGVIAAMGDLLWLYDGHAANGVSPEKIAQRKLNYGKRIQEAYDALSGGANLSPKEIEGHAETLVSAISTMRLQLRETDGAPAGSSSSESNLQVDAKLGKRAAIVEGFEFENLQLAPAIFNLIARRAETEPRGFGLAYRQMREVSKVELWTSVRLGKLQTAVSLGSGMSTKLLRDNISEVYESIWESQAPSLTTEMRSEATRNALLELFVISSLRAVESEYAAQMTQSWGQVYLRVSRAMARTSRANTDTSNQSFTQSTQEIVLAVRLGLESLMRSDQLQMSTDQLRNSVEQLNDMVTADHQLFRAHFGFIESMMLNFQQANQARFDQIDTSLNFIYKSMFKNFDIVKQALRVAKKDAEEIKASLRELAVSLDRMDRRLSLHLADSQNRLFNQTWERCVQRKSNFSSSKAVESMTYEKFQDCVSDFITYAADASKDSFNVDDAKRDYKDLHTELSKPTERNLGFIARIGSEITDENGEPVALDLRAYTDLPNWSEWNIASEAILTLMQQYPNFGLRLSEGGLAKVVDRGEHLNRFATAITMDSEGQPRPGLLKVLLARHQKNLNEFFSAFETYANDYQVRAERDGNLPKGMRIFAKSKNDLADILSESKASFALPAEIAACPDAKFFQFTEDKVGVNLSKILSRATPAGKLKAPEAKYNEELVSSLSPYFLAEHLGLGKVSSCVEGLKWSEEGQAATLAADKRIEKIAQPIGKSALVVRYVSDEKGERIEAEQGADGNNIEDPAGYFGDEFDVETHRGGKLTAMVRLHFAVKGAPALNIFPIAKIGYQSPEVTEFRSQKVRYVASGWKKVEDLSNKSAKPIYVASLVRKDTLEKDLLNIRESFSARMWPGEFKAQTPALARDPDLSCLAENSAGQPGVSAALCGYFLSQRQRFSESFGKNMSNARAPLRQLARKLDESQILLARFVDIGMGLQLRADDEFRAAFEGSSGLRAVSERLMKGVSENSLNPLQLRADVESNFHHVDQQIDDFFAVCKSEEWVPSQAFLRVETAIGNMSLMREKQLLKRQGTEKIEEAFDALGRRVIEEISKINSVAKGN